MKTMHADVLVLGSGFGGSLLSLILTKTGRRCALVDKSCHPRFAIGESSTPLADFVLSDLARRFDLADILPLASYGTWQKHYPQLRCGLKRGFSYFHHTPGQPFETDANHANQLLVAASSDDLDSDTHWYRADVDSFLFASARDAGVECFENTQVESMERGVKWRVGLRGESEHTTVCCDVVIDASGRDGVLLQHLGVADETHMLQTRSQAVFGHFESVSTFDAVLQDSSIDTEMHPYLCDDAALHHVAETGWMWVLRFADGLVSAGVVERGDLRGQASPTARWEQWLRRFPSVGRQFSAAYLVQSPGLLSTGRMQRLRAAAAGQGWFALPNSTGFIDPLHSTGIAHTLSAVERIADLFVCGLEADDAAVRGYSQDIRCELLFIDELVSGCYAALGRPELFSAWTMLYFAAAHSCELRRVSGEPGFERGFLGAGIPELCEIVSQSRRELDVALESNSGSAERRFHQQLAAAMTPFNQAGLCDPAARGMYANTAPPRNLGSV